VLPACLKISRKSFVRNVLASVVLIALMLSLIFYMRSVYIMSPSQAMVFFEPSISMRRLFLNQAFDKELTEDNVKGIRVVYFYQHHCACDQLVKTHFLQLKEAYRQGKLAVSFYMAVLDDRPIDGDLSAITMFPPAALEAIRADVQATPSVAIWNSENELVYFGPHSPTDVCNDDSSLIKKVVDALLSGKPFNALSIVDSSCYCSIND